MITPVWLLRVGVLGALLATGCQTSDLVAPSPPSSSPSTGAPTVRPPREPTSAPVPRAVAGPDPTERFEDPASLATALLRSERALRSGRVTAQEHARWAWAQQAAYRQLVEHPEWDDVVRARIPARLKAVFEANLLAGRQLRSLTEPREQLPPWRIVAPPPVAELLDAWTKAGAEFGIDPSYLAAIHLVETRMGRIEGDSTAGARGPMQFLPSTWDAWGEGDIEDPHDAIRAAARYLAGHGAPQDMRGALWAYNHSERYVDAVEAYASVMRAEPEQYRTYHGWQVYYRLASGDVVLEVGWDNR